MTYRTVSCAASAVMITMACSTSARGRPCSGDVSEGGMVDGTQRSALVAGWGPYVPVPVWATLLEVHSDPAVVDSESLWEAIAATEHAWRVRDAATLIEMVLIPPGTFEMGCSSWSFGPCCPNENPVRTVTLTNTFYTERRKVTHAQWVICMGRKP